MVQVPTLNQSEKQLQPTPIPQSAMGALGGNIVDLSKGLEGLADHFQKVQDFSDQKKAEALFTENYNNRIYKLASTDPDLATLPQRIDEETNKVIEDSTGGIHSADVRNNVTQDFRKQIALKDPHIQTIIMNRQKVDARASLYTSINADIKDAHRLPPGQLQDIKVQRMQDSLDQAEGLGLITPDQNKRLGETQFNKMSVDQVYHDLDLAEHGGQNSDKQFATIKSELQKGSSGMYKYLHDEQAERLSGTIDERQQKAKILQEKQFKDYQINNEFNALDEYTKGKQFTTADISEQVASGKMNPRLGQAWIQYIQSPHSVRTTGQEDLKAFARMSDGIFGAWDKESTRNSMVKLLNEAEAGHIKNESLFLLVKAANDRQKDLINTDGSKKSGWNLFDASTWFKKDSKQSAVSDGYRRVQNYAGDNEDDKGKGAYHYVNEVSKGTDPGVAATGAIQKIDNVQGLFPNYQSYPEEGKTFFKPGIGYFKVFPNGSWKKSQEQAQENEEQ